MKSILVTILILSPPCFTPLRAQQVDLFLGFGTARASSSGRSIDTFGDGALYSTPSMRGVFTDFGATVFFNRQLGVGWTSAWRAAHDYAGLQYHQTFHTLDAVFQPSKFRITRIWPELRAGIGFAGDHFDYDDPTACAQVPGCPSSHHFLGHAALAARLYVTNHVFLRPAVDVQYVHNFFEFGSNWVPRYSISFGYSFGKE